MALTNGVHYLLELFSIPAKYTLFTPCPFCHQNPSLTLLLLPDHHLPLLPYTPTGLKIPFPSNPDSCTHFCSHEVSRNP